ncbi:MAG: glycosyltransferase [Bacteroidia bacterium]
MNAFSTIITPDYIHYALALRESLIRFNTEINFFILVTEKDEELKEKIEKKYPGVTVFFGQELCKDGIGKKIYDKYFNNLKDEFRWSMKPVLLKYLIEKLNFDKVLYLDCDIFFFNSYDFLFEKLETSRVILTPHWRSMNPHLDEVNFQIQFNEGLYNAGFVGVNKNSIEILDWWAMVCEYVCVKQPEKGYYVDQSHLNLFQIKFDSVEILKHKGCNVAAWNQLECKRTIGKDGKVLINDEFPVVFIHFTNSTIKEIMMEIDYLLKPHLQEYAAALNKIDPSFDLIAKHIQNVSNYHKPENDKWGIKKIKKLFSDGN